MAVRCKFKLTKVESTMYLSGYEKQPDGKNDYNKPKNVEQRTLVFNAVSGNADPDHENTKFWEATPSGEFRFGTVNKAAWEQFQLGEEYYVDFTPATK